MVACMLGFVDFVVKVEKMKQLLIVPSLLKVCRDLKPSWAHLL